MKEIDYKVNKSGFISCESDDVVGHKIYDGDVEDILYGIKNDISLGKIISMNVEKVDNFESFCSVDFNFSITMFDKLGEEYICNFDMNGLSKKQYQEFLSLEKFANCKRIKRRVEKYKHKNFETFGGILKKNLYKNMRVLSSFILKTAVATLLCSIACAPLSDLSLNLYLGSVAIPPAIFTLASVVLSSKSLIESVSEYNKIKKKKVEDDEKNESESKDLSKDDRVSLKNEIVEKVKEIRSLMSNLDNESATYYRMELVDRINSYTNNLDVKPKNSDDVILKMDSSISSEIQFLLYLDTFKDEILKQIKKESYKKSIDDLKEQIILDDKAKTGEVDDTVLDDIIEDMGGFALSRKQK